MKLVSLLNKDLIFWDLDVNNHEELYKTVAQKVSEKFDIKADSIFDAFINRDKLGYTVFPNGISLPHGRLENFNDLIIAVVKLKKPFEINQNQVDLFFMLLTSNVGSNLYLKTLGAFARTARNYADKIRNFKNEDEFYNFMEETGVKVNESVKAKDIMTENPFTVNLDDPLMQVMDLMKKSNHTFFPVVDSDKKYLGKIDLLDIFKIAYPEYILSLKDLSFVSNLRAYEEFAEKEKHMLVKDVFKKEKEKIIYEDQNILEVGFFFLKNHWHHVTVLDKENKVTGVISLNNILNNILRV